MFCVILLFTIGIILFTWVKLSHFVGIGSVELYTGYSTDIALRTSSLVYRTISSDETSRCCLITADEANWYSLMNEANWCNFIMQTILYFVTWLWLKRLHVDYHKNNFQCFVMTLMNMWAFFYVLTKIITRIFLHRSASLGSMTITMWLSSSVSF